MDKKQARKLYELADRLSKLDVNTLSEEQLAERSAMIARLQEVKQRLDPKCWKGKHKEGTKIKGGVRVNNCVPNESVEEAYPGHVQKGRELDAATKGIQANLDKRIKQVDSLVTDALKIMRGPTMNDALDALKTVLGNREYNGRRGYYNFYVKQLIDMYGQQGVSEASSPVQQAAIAINMKKHHKKPMGEADGEYDDEAGMAQGSLKTMSRAVNGLMDVIQQGDNLPEWAQEKLSLAEDYLTTVWDYLLSQKEQGIEPKLENTIKEFAPDAGDGGEEETLHKYARMWYNGDLDTQQQVEKILDRMGWEIGEIESEEGGAFVVRAGDENGNSYIGFAVSDLTEAKKPNPKLTPVVMKKTEPVSEEINKEAYERLQKVFAFKNYES